MTSGDKIFLQKFIRRKCENFHIVLLRSVNEASALSFSERTLNKSIASQQYSYLVFCYGWRLLQNFFHCLYNSLCSHNTDRANQLDQ